jgi:molybdenum cofactor cytidylyltransferase
MEIDGQKVLARTLSEINRASFDEIALVGGHDWDLVRQVSRSFPLRVAYNERYDSGLYSSLVCGLSRFAAGFDFVTVCLADQPLLQARDYEAILERIRRTRKKLVVPVYNGQRGTPTSFSKELFSAILERDEGDQGAAFLLKEYADEIETVDMRSEATLQDVDTPDDLAQLRAGILHPTLQPLTP